MNPALNRRHFLNRLTQGLGGIALADLLGGVAHAAGEGTPGLPGFPHFPPKVKRVIFMFMSGGMTQHETFDYKPELQKRLGQELPDSYKSGRQALLGMSGNQAQFPLVGSAFKFAQHGQSGAWVSEALPHLAKMADDICFIKSMKSDAVNHDPAMTFMHTGAQLPGRPSMGAWVTYGLGSENANLPSFVVLVSKSGFDQPLSTRLWDSGFLPSQYQGVQFRAAKDAVLYLGNPKGATQENTRHILNAMQSLAKVKDGPETEIHARMEQFEMAFRMQTSIPGVTDLSGEPDSVFEMYGPESRKPGSFASNCILARRLAEKGVRFVQLFQPNWDMHGHIVRDLTKSTTIVDQPAAALLQDLKQRDMLKDTLVVFGTEFGRTPYSQGRLRGDPPDYGREHHRDCFTMWMAGGGVRGGITHGASDELGFGVAQDPVTVNDLHATMLHLLGVDHERFTYRFQGRDFRLTDVAGNVVRPILA
ncbi:DUF1501 domain-containing protein [Roseimicrobium sp. ORNL1]|uniref:DUF1501 domain-containing protein n=1 Tax=Roseimicrobium sp. ORNL1 TaxID=2711231 RepID=UPI0013E1B4AD|nr:DUF1501 domain-containing protein [Roseimicrobium sp. ORNL1]QIF01046.1 DUF1501 domain-containing protein [Roseimicrobium sp. ORNL1]